eukprot:CAMPEP_0114985316 /NCGR_PEP_ID=MMETSP0216-20121206/7787_1 /TAXON_ID=223996 /ORGANISM="Protocruzia adherens, Strain Boccale" /LENGTH=74 /DNA_ID=CAMNT_0002347595 /DNA_START=138 /DNA_END=362 /DNA_ORIENTATION=-
MQGMWEGDFKREKVMRDKNAFQTPREEIQNSAILEASTRRGSESSGLGKLSVRRSRKFAWVDDPERADGSVQCV